MHGILLPRILLPESRPICRCILFSVPNSKSVENSILKILMKLQIQGNNNEQPKECVSFIY